MATKSQKIRVGAFVLVTSTLLAIVLVVFGGIRFWEDHVRYYVSFGNTVMGLEDGAHVFLNGIRVGHVEEITPDPTDLRRVRVSIAVKADTPVKTDTRAMLQFAGITGLKVIDLRDGTLGAPGLPPGSAIPEGETVLDKLEREAKELADQSTELMKRATRIVDNVVTITDPARFADVDDILAQARTTATNLATTSAQLEAIVAENRSALRSTFGAVTGLATKAGEVIAGLDAMVRANEGPLRSAVFDLRQASRNFKELSRDVKQRPSRLLFGKPPAERKLP